MKWNNIFYPTAIFLLILVYAEVHAHMKARRPELPKTVGTWQRPDRPRLVDASNIFKYMNGAGELYLGYRFKNLEVYEYRADCRENIIAEIYFMETPEDAFGLLSQDWEGESVALKPSRPRAGQTFRAPTDRAFYDIGLLRMASANIYARIMTPVETPESKNAVLAIGRTILADEKHLDEPRLLHILPRKLMQDRHLQRDRIRYFRSYMVLNSFYYLSFKNILNLDLSTEAVTATYGNKAKGERRRLRRGLSVFGILP